MKVIRSGLIIVLVLLALIVVSLLSLFTVYPRTEYTVPLTVDPSDYTITTVDGLPILIEHGLPYPTDFDAVSFPTQDLGGTWKMRLDPNETGEDDGWQLVTDPQEGWTEIQIPSTYNAYESPYRKHEGVAWFVVTFVPKRVRVDGSFARLCFNGILLRSKVWLNGVYLGSHEGGYTPFFLDVTDALVPGKKNVLVVRTDNRLTFSSLPEKSWKGHSPGWGVYGGVYRDVSLSWIPRTYPFKAIVTAPSGVDIPGVTIDVFIHNYGTKAPYTLSGVLTAPDGRRYPIVPKKHTPTGEFDAIRVEVPVTDPSYWSPEDPALYNLELGVTSGANRATVKTKIGFRTIETGADGLFLNGKPIFLRGISKHEDDPLLGATQDERIIDRDLDLIQAMNANFIRMAHYPHDVREIREARDRGIMVSEEIPYYKTGIGWAEWYQENKGFFEFPVSTFGMRQLNDAVLMKNAQRQLIEMVERDRNNPAVIMWLVANETYTLFEDAGRFHGWMRDVVRYFDRTRSVTMAEQTYDIPILDDNRRSADYMDVASLNTYYGWYYGTFDGISEHLGRFHTRFPDRPIILSEFGAEAAPGRHDADGVWIADRVRPGKTYSEEYQEKVIRGYVTIAREKKYVIGVCPWVFADFWCPWFPTNPVPDYNTKGVVSRDRVPKESYRSLTKLYSEIKNEQLQ